MKLDDRVRVQQEIFKESEAKWWMRLYEERNQLEQIRVNDVKSIGEKYQLNFKKKEDEI